VTGGAFDRMAAGGNPLGVAMQIPDVLLSLREAAGRFPRDPGRAAGYGGLLDRWAGAAPETRAGILLSLAWGARETRLPDREGTAAAYAGSLHEYAREFAGDSEAFHGARFPAMPLPGQAGALASSLAFDADDALISLESALLLLAATLPEAAGKRTWRPCADCLAPSMCEYGDTDMCP